VALAFILQETGVGRMQLKKEGIADEAMRLPNALRLGVLPALILSALAQPAHAAALGPAAAAAAPAAGGLVNFDTDFMPSGIGGKVDISRFEKGNVVLPGTYSSDVTLNEQWRGRNDITFKLVPGLEQAQPCFDIQSLTKLGIDLRKVYGDASHPARKRVPADGQFCGPIGDYIPGATAAFDPSDLTFSLSVPQLYVSRDARGYVDPSQWDSGVNALLLNYNANVYRSERAGRDNTNGYLGINGSLNLGSWHLMHMGSLSWSQDQKPHYQAAATYLQHDVPSLKAGDVFTSGRLFDSVRLLGARFYTDDRMYPQSQQGFAPVVRGVAETNARVVVKQRGTIIYETTVAPGPFVIDDLYPTGYGGDLNVEIVEADGRIRYLIVPFDAVPQLLRPGQSRWEVAGGKVEQYGLKDAPGILQATYQRGINNLVTGYGGITAGTGYFSVLGGAAFNTPVGAVSVDATQSHSRIPGKPAMDGGSFRVAYSKNITSTGTNLGVAAYRYSTSGFLGLNDYVNLRSTNAGDGSNWTLPRSRNQLSFNVSQQLGDGNGQLFVTGIARDYWNQRGRQVDFSAGYSNSWRRMSYSINVQRSRDSTQSILPSTGGLADVIPGLPSAYNPIVAPTRRDTTVFLNLSIPLGSSSRSPSLTGQFTHSQQAGTNSQVLMSGSAGANSQYGYSVAAGHASGDTSFSTYGSYSGSRVNLTGGYGHGTGYNQYSAGASGSLVAHSGGVTFGKPTGDTVALVHAPGAQGASITGTQGVTVNRSGYAVVPYLTPYLSNTVSIDPKGAAANVELKSTTQTVAPRAGTVTRLRYETSVGRAVLIDARLPDGKSLPFGADVFDEKGNSVGVVGQASRVFVHGLENSGALTVKWGDEANESCRIQVDLPPMQKGARQDDYEKYNLSCSQPGAAITAPLQTAPLKSETVQPESTTGSITRPASSEKVTSDGSQKSTAMDGGEAAGTYSIFGQSGKVDYTNPRLAMLTRGA
jgi:outer membrane usher protein